MFKRKESQERFELAVTLLVLEALESKRNRPLQLRDLERSMYLAIGNAINAGELQPAEYLHHDPGSLFANLQQLRQRELVERLAEGYAITDAGRHQAGAWRQSLFRSSTAERLEEGAAAAA